VRYSVSTYSHCHSWLNFEVERRNAGAIGNEDADPSARRLNSFAAQRRRGEFGWLAQDDNLLGFSQ
jgi:hypothetical protein